MSVGATDSNTNALKGLSSAIFQSEIFGMILFDLNRLDMLYHLLMFRESNLKLIQNVRYTVLMVIVKFAAS